MTALEEEIPKGKSIRSLQGGKETLKNLIKTIGSYSFTGYIKVSLEQPGGDKNLGYLFSDEGKIKFQIYEREGHRYYGRESLKFIVEDSTYPESKVELFRLDDVADFLDKIQSPSMGQKEEKPKIVLSWGQGAEQQEAGAEPAPSEIEAEPELMVPEPEPEATEYEPEPVQEPSRPKVKPQPVKKEEPVPDISSFIQKLQGWENDGYILPFEPHHLESEPEMAEMRVTKLESDIERLKEIQEEMEGLNTRGLTDLASHIEEMLMNPSALEEIEEDLAELKEMIQERDKEESAAIKQMEMEMEQKKVSKIRERKKDEVYKLVAKVKEKPLEKGPADLIIDYHFENFVVGESNRFAFAAAQSVAKEPGTGYNPLFLWSGAGLGKTHLLNAIGNHIHGENPNAKVLYTTTEKFTNDLIEALQNNTLLQFRQKYRSADVLIVDDAQFLAGKERTQEEFFHTFNTLYIVDKQIILASDRPPNEIPTLEERLVSRFEGGLIASIQAPSFETRMAILKQKVKDNDLNVPDDVLMLIAEKVVTNIRELGGALNKVVAFSTLMNQEIGIELAKDVLKDYDLPSKQIQPAQVQAVPQAQAPQAAQASPQPAQAPIEEEIEGAVSIQELEDGHTYMIEEEKAKKCFELFTEQVESNRKGLCITRVHQRRLTKVLPEQDLDFFWLSDRESKTLKTISYSLERLIYEMDTFIENNDNGVMLLDGITYLVNNNSFDAVLRFIRRLIDEISETNAILLISVSPKTLTPQEIKILEREMTVLNFL